MIQSKGSSLGQHGAANDNLSEPLTGIDAVMDEDEDEDEDEVQDEPQVRIERQRVAQPKYCISYHGLQRRSERSKRSAAQAHYPNERSKRSTRPMASHLGAQVCGGTSQFIDEAVA